MVMRHSFESHHAASKPTQVTAVPPATLKSVQSAVVLLLACILHRACTRPLEAMHTWAKHACQASLAAGQAQKAQIVQTCIRDVSGLALDASGSRSSREQDGSTGFPFDGRSAQSYGYGAQAA